MEARNFDIEVDILAKAMANGARIAEVPIRYRRRIGRKKLRPWHGASIASKMVSLAYRLNPTLPLTIAGALLLIPGAALAGWVAYRFFYQGVPHYLLGTLAIILILLGGASIALLPLATSIIRLQAAVARAARRHEPPTASPAAPATTPSLPEARGAASHSSGEGGAGAGHSLHGALGNSRLLPRRRRRKYSRQAGPVGLLRPGRSRPGPARRHGCPPQALRFFKMAQIIPWMLMS